jgi:hypothetical protein
MMRPSTSDARAAAAPNPLLLLAAGRAAFGVVAVAAAVPLCRMAEITTQRGTARRIGVALAVIDGVSVIGALASSNSDARRRVAIVNASSDLIMAAGLAGLAMRRHGRARAVNMIGGASVAGGGLAWVRMARQLAGRSASFD